MAEAWGQHPEDIYTRPGGMRWAAWWKVFREEQHEAQKDTQRKAKKKQQG